LGGGGLFWLKLFGVINFDNRIIVYGMFVNTLRSLMIACKYASIEKKYIRKMNKSLIKIGYMWNTLTLGGWKE